MNLETILATSLGLLAMWLGYAYSRKADRAKRLEEANDDLQAQISIKKTIVDDLGNVIIQKDNTIKNLETISLDRQNKVHSLETTCSEHLATINSLQEENKSLKELVANPKEVEEAKMTKPVRKRSPKK